DRDKKNVMLETVKLAEDGSGVILRMYEYENALTKVKVSLGEDVLSVKECNLIEEEQGDVYVTDNCFVTTIKPYEIKTFKVVLK
ncbi:MAG: glycosyl hydrolase-related protein, partial [Ignavibacteria bacterium]|nr:glycosyl hydrolase-related protein [Ignavibacteria bacterium]